MTHSNAAKINANAIGIDSSAKKIQITNLLYEKSQFNFLKIDGLTQFNVSKSILLENITVQNLKYIYDTFVIVFDGYFNEFGGIVVN